MKLKIDKAPCRECIKYNQFCEKGNMCPKWKAYLRKHKKQNDELEKQYWLKVNDKART